MINQDLAGKETWDNIWQFNEMPEPINAANKHYNNTVNQRMHQYFAQAFAGKETRGMKLMEVGAARSTWLPYFAQEFGFDVAGLDYSEIGCKQTEAIFAKTKVNGQMIHADMFAPPSETLNVFDVVLSIGVIEHFTDTIQAIRAIGSFLKPGGLMITQIPNMVGSVGWLQKQIDRSIYDIHVRIDRENMRKLHEQAGLKVLKCDYFMFSHYGVANMHKVAPNSPGYAGKHFAHVQLQRLSKLFWLFENALFQLPANRLTSPYVMCTATK